MFLSKKSAKSVADYSNVNSLGSKFRARRVAPLVKMIEKVHEKKGLVSIADVGGTEKYWNIIPSHILYDNHVSITIINLPACLPEKNYDIFTFISADACNLSCFENNVFDIAHSNSVVEHVGDWDRMVSFASELKRIAPKYFIQTPNYWFPVEPHCMTLFFHWLPRPLRIWLIMNFQLGHWRQSKSIGEAVRLTESARLLNKKMMLELFNDGELIIERFLYLPKSFISIRK